MVVVIVLFSSFSSFSATVFAGDLAIIVHNQNPIDNVSFKDLVRIFKQEKQYWEGDKRIYLVMQETGSSGKEIVLKKIYQMNDEELKKFWLTKLFRGEITSFPKTLSSIEAIKRLVTSVPNAIGFIDVFFADGSIKVLRIDGRLPGEESYKLSDLK